MNFHVSFFWVYNKIKAGLNRKFLYNLAFKNDEYNGNLTNSEKETYKLNFHAYKGIRT